MQIKHFKIGAIMASPCDHIRDFYAQFADQGVSRIETNGLFGGRKEVYTIPYSGRLSFRVSCETGINTLGFSMLQLPRIENSIFLSPTGEVTPALRQDVFYTRKITPVDVQGVTAINTMFTAVTVHLPVPAKK